MARLAGFETDCFIRFDGERVPARRGEPVASALLAAGRVLLARSPKYHRPRGAFCLAGSCGSCLVRAGGLPSRRACRTPCRDGLVVESQNAFPDARHDLLGAIDLATPRGLDHHRLATWSLVANRAAVSLARRLSGVGRLPDERGLRDAGAPILSPEERPDVLVVGAGPAGLAAAESLAEAGRRVLLAERDEVPGGRLRARLGAPGDPDLGWAAAVVERVVRAGGEAALGLEVLGLWHDGGAPIALLVGDGPPPRARLVRPGRIVVCAGGHPQPLSIPGGDRPGVHAGRGLAVLLAEHGAVPGRSAVVVGDGAEAAALAGRLAAAGVAVEGAGLAAARRVAGRGRARALILAGGRVRCDAVAVAAPPAPALDLPRALGVEVRFDPLAQAFAVRAGADGRTSVPGLLAAGEVTGVATAAQAAEAGRRAGEAARG